MTQGTPAGRWRLGMAPPKPDLAQLKHPRRLLMADLETHLMHYALDPNCTLVLMGDMLSTSVRGLMTTARRYVS